MHGMRTAADSSSSMWGVRYSMKDSLDYFYAPPNLITGDEVVIDGDEFAHMVHVMRKKEGDVIRVVDGLGNAYDVQLYEMRKRTAHGRVARTLVNHNEMNMSITLAAGVLKNPSRFDFLVEKATELGVHEIFPLKTHRAIPHHAKSDRWQKLALSAMKQSCRSYLPRVRSLTQLEEVLEETSQFDMRIIAHEGFDANARIESPDLQKHNARTLLLLIGPEGGFTDEEVRLCLSAGSGLKLPLLPP